MGFNLTLTPLQVAGGLLGIIGGMAVALILQGIRHRRALRVAHAETEIARKQLAELREQLDRGSEQAASAAAQIAELERQLATAREHYETLRAWADSAAARLADLTTVQHQLLVVVATEVVPDVRKRAIALLASVSDRLLSEFAACGQCFGLIEVAEDAAAKAAGNAHRATEGLRRALLSSLSREADRLASQIPGRSGTLAETIAAGEPQETAPTS